MFKEAEVLPRKLPNFGKVDNFVYLTIKLSFTPFAYLKIATANDFSLRPLSFLSLAIISMCHELCILSCDKLISSIVSMSRGKVEDHGRFRSRFKRSTSPKSCSQLREGVLIVFITLIYCYGISLREKENSVKKRPKKIIISLAAINSYVMLSLKYVMQELSLNDIYVSHWSFGKCKIRIMRLLLKFGTFFFSLKILSRKILKLKKFALVRPGPNTDYTRFKARNDPSQIMGIRILTCHKPFRQRLEAGAGVYTCESSP